MERLSLLDGIHSISRCRSAKKKNPHVCVSNDRIHWKPFEGEGKAVSLDPLTPFEDPDKQYNSDTHLVYRKDIDTLECYWRQVDNRTRIDKIMKRTTTDGIHWSKAQNVLVSDARTDRILVRRSFMKRTI